jgi:hypothetical protein
MLQTFGEVMENGNHVGLSFRATDRWTVPDDLVSSSRTADTPFDSTALLLGDAVMGPVLLFLAVQPGFTPPDAPAHGHASDNFRISLRGILPMGPESYDEGEFRFQRGWKPYPSDNYAHGPEGGWTVLCFADRRGMRVRHVSPDAPTHAAGDAKLAAWLGIRSDLTSDDPADTAGPSALTTTLGEFRKPFLNGSYADSGEWPRIDETTRAAGALLGDVSRGPVMILSTTSAGGRASGGLTVGTEVFHLVVRGSCTIDGVEQLPGDMYVQRAGTPMGPVVAGPEGVDELIVLGDRREAVPVLPNGLHGWPTVIRSLTSDLAETLADRP